MTASQVSKSSFCFVLFFNLFYCEKQDTAQKGSSGSQPSHRPCSKDFMSSPSTVTERLNNLLKVTKLESGTVALPPKQAGLSL